MTSIILALTLFCATPAFAAKFSQSSTNEISASTNCTAATTLLVSLGNTSTIVDGKAVDVPVISLRMKPPQLSTNSEISLTFKVLSLVKPSASYTYVPGASKTFTGDMAVGATIMLPMMELKVIRTIVELGPQYTTAIVGGKKEYIGGLGATLGLVQSSTGKLSGFFLFFGAGWDVNRSDLVYTTGFGHSIP